MSCSTEYMHNRVQSKDIYITFHSINRPAGSNLHQYLQPSSSTNPHRDRSVAFFSSTAQPVLPVLPVPPMPVPSTCLVRVRVAFGLPSVQNTYTPPGPRTVP
jgi:hypothetical protein